jgi:hypothetical protein
VKCTEVCGKQLDCGHKCPDLCSECQERSKPQKSEEKKVSIVANLFFPIEHGKCQSVCNKLLFCDHICKSNCHGKSECPPCENNCPRKNNSCIIN